MLDKHDVHIEYYYDVQYDFFRYRVYPRVNLFNNLNVVRSRQIPRARKHTARDTATVVVVVVIIITYLYKPRSIYTIIIYGYPVREYPRYDAFGKHNVECVISWCGFYFLFFFYNVLPWLERKPGHGSRFIRSGMYIVSVSSFRLWPSHGDTGVWISNFHFLVRFGEFYNQLANPRI